MKLGRIGILGLGEMGSAWARTLRSHDVQVLSYLSGRSPETLQRARESGVQDCTSMSAFLDSCDLVVSIVSPKAAPQVAEAVAKAASSARARPLYLEANAVAPETAMEIAQILGASGIDVVDGGIIGTADHLDRGTYVFLSGSRASDLLGLQEVGISVRVVGTEIGQASALKMINAGIHKGITILLTELLCGSYRMGILEEALRLYEERFPGLVGRHQSQIMSNTLHGVRRAQEMDELEDTFSRLGLLTSLIPATGEVLSRIGNDLVSRKGAQGASKDQKGLAEVIALLSRSGGPFQSGSG